jgi:2-iminobutanoate/2-iminopropanoate deaminase
MSTETRITPVVPAGVAPPTAPYSHALLIEGGRLLLISGQGPVDAEGNVPSVDDPEAQVRQVFRNIEALVKAGGGRGLADVVEITCYLRDMRHRAVITKVRNELLTPPFPTSTMFGVTALAFDDWLVEISAIAVV